MKSKTKFVTYLLLVRKIVTKFWSFSPEFISHFIFNYFRHSTTYFAFGLRYLALHRLSKSCGEKVIVFPGVFLKNIEKLEIGNNVTIHEMSYIDAYGGIKIGNDVAISHGVSMISFDHDIHSNYNNYKDAPALIGNIIIKNNVWIGAGAKILRNVTIEKDSVIGAGSLMNKSCKEKSVMVGIPAICIKKMK